jgi:hypothetical protein
MAKSINERFEIRSRLVAHTSHTDWKREEKRKEGCRKPMERTYVARVERESVYYSLSKHSAASTEKKARKLQFT